MTHATPADLISRAARLERRANENIMAGLCRVASGQREQAGTLRQLAREAQQWAAANDNAPRPVPTPRQATGA